MALSGWGQILPTRKSGLVFGPNCSCASFKPRGFFRTVYGFEQKRIVFQACRHIGVVGAQQRVRPMLGFKRFETAAVTIRGIELAEKIKKQQFNLKPLTGKATTAPGIWAAVLAA